MKIEILPATLEIQIARCECGGELKSGDFTSGRWEHVCDRCGRIETLGCFYPCPRYSYSDSPNGDKHGHD